MNPHVVLEATRYCAGVIALCAVEGLLTWVGQLVFLECTRLCARVFTLIALERLFSWMFPHVPFEISSYRAWVLALVATVGLHCILQRSFRNFCHSTSNSNVSFGWCDRQGWRITELKRAQIRNCNWKEKVIKLSIKWQGKAKFDNIAIVVMIMMWSLEKMP